MNNKILERQKIEKDYHNKKTREAASNRRSSGGQSYVYFGETIGNVSGLRTLDFGCGDGWMSISLAKQGAEVYGIDISEELIAKARQLAEVQSLSHNITFEVMTGEDLKFPADFFDLIIGSAVLHHTEMELALASISRVIKPSGRAVFIEPMNQNIILKIWRTITPWRRSTTEKALGEYDLKLIKSIFPESKLHYFTLLSMVTTGLLLLSPTNRLLLLLNNYMERIDGAILKAIPSFGKYAAVVVLDLRKDKSN